MDKVWLEARSNIEKVLTPQTFNNWIKPIRFLSIKKDSLQLEVPDRFFKEWIQDNYLPIITEAVSAVSHVELQIDLKIAPKKSQEEVPTPAEQVQGVHRPE